MTMYNHQLETFIRVADCGSFNKAAEEMFISSTAVIKQINSLEDSLDVRLFDRTHAGIKLTKAGSLIYTDAKTLIRFSRASIERAKQIENENIIRVAISPFNPSEYIDSILPELEERIESVHFEIYQYTNSLRDVSDLLKNMGKEADLIFGACDENMYGIDTLGCLVLREDPVYLGVPNKNRLAGKDCITVKDLQKETVCILERGFYSHIDTLRDELEKMRSVRIANADFYDFPCFNQCVNNNWLLVMLTNANVHPLLKVKRVEWDFKIPFGVIYAKDKHKSLKHVLDALREMYPSSYCM